MRKQFPGSAKIATISLCFFLHVRALGLKTIRKKVTHCGKGIGGRFVGPRSVFHFPHKGSQI